MTAVPMHEQLLVATRNIPGPSRMHGWASEEAPSTKHGDSPRWSRAGPVISRRRLKLAGGEDWSRIPSDSPSAFVPLAPGHFGPAKFLSSATHSHSKTQLLGDMGM